MPRHAHRIDAARTACAFALLATLCSSPAQAWWKDEWQYRKQITLDSGVSALAARAGVADIVVPVRLHAGNFGYFGDTLPDGADLRFVAGDDATPLDLRVERYDAAIGVAVVWVRIPVTQLATASHVWMYYGNERATSVAASALEDAQTVLSYDFAEKSGPPRDGTAYATSAASVRAQAGATGAVDLALAFDEGSSVTLPPSPALTFMGAQGFTWSAWVKPEAGRGAGLLYRQAGAGGGLEILAGHGRLSVTLAGERSPVALAAPLAPGAWHAVGVVAGARLALFVDGVEVATSSTAMRKLDGPALLGTDGSRPAFVGALDVLRISNVARPADWFALQYALQRAESDLLQYGDDESREGSGWQAELALLRQLMGSVTIDGWIVIALIGVLGLFSADVWLRKLRLLHVADRADREFERDFAAGWDRDRAALLGNGTAPATDETDSRSPLERLYRVALRETAELPGSGGRGRIAPGSLDVVRASLDAKLVEEIEMLQKRLVLMTIAVAGGPFLGLLGTVMGVMITFASIAASGDVNVNTIAPGISAALFATVVGLLVAIPSLFGYNFVATRIAARVTAMEAFANRLVARLHAALVDAPAGGASTQEEPAHAA